MEYSVSNLFADTGILNYCSETSPNIVATGVLMNEDMNEYRNLAEELNSYFLNKDAISVKCKNT